MFDLDTTHPFILPIALCNLTLQTRSSPQGHLTRLTSCQEAQGSAVSSKSGHSCTSKDKAEITSPSGRALNYWVTLTAPTVLTNNCSLDRVWKTCQWGASKELLTALALILLHGAVFTFGLWFFLFISFFCWKKWIKDSERQYREEDGWMTLFGEKV